VGDSAIEWTDKTWGPVRGCSPASEGCRNCFAVRQAIRFADAGELEDPGVWLRKPGPFHGFAKSTPQGPRWTGRVELVSDKLDEPLRWRKPLRVFVNSMSDLFHESLPDADIVRVLDVIRQNECRDYPHTMQVLTKRPARMLSIMSRLQFDASGAGRMWLEDRRSRDGVPLGIAGIFRHLWLGVSVEDQQAADERIPLLLQTPAAVRFISLEPMLGPVDLGRYYFTTLPGRESRDYPFPMLAEEDRTKWVDLLDLVIVGGESGPRRRPLELAWLESVAAQCDAAGVPLFVKQDSGLRSGAQGRIPDALWARKEFPR
jgi:protein gp37